MNIKDFEMVDELTELAQDQKAWTKRFGKFTLADVIKARFNKGIDVVQFGEVGNVFSGVCGSYANRIRIGKSEKTVVQNCPKDGRVVVIRKNPGKSNEKVIKLFKYGDTYRPFKNQ